MEKWTAPAIASLRGDNTIPLQRTFGSLTEYLSLLSDSYIPAGGTAGQILSKIDGTDFNTQWIDNFAEKTKTLVKSDNSSTLPKGAAVYTSGANGTNILVKGAIATSDATSATVLGLLDQSLATNAQGYVVTEGLVTGIDTSAAVAGDPVWLSPTVIGGLTFGLANKPHAPYHLVYLGVVTRAHATNGEINVHMLNGWELEELHNVSALSPTTGDTIVYNASTSLWEKGKYPAGQLSGTTLASNVVSSSLTSVGTLSAGSIPASLLTGTIGTARISGSYTGITGLGTLTSLSISGTITSPTQIIVNGSNASSPQLEIGDWNQDGRYTALRTNIGYLLLGSTGVNTNIYLRTESGAGAVYIGGQNTNTLEVGSTSAKVYGFLDVDGASSQNIRIGDWTGGASYSVIENAYGYLLMGAAGDQRMYLRTYANDVRIGTPASDTLIVSGTNVSINKPINAQLEVSNTNVYISGTGGAYFQHANNTGSGQAAQWATVFGIYYLVRNTSTKADKENIQPLNGVLTPQMIDAIDVTLWNRKIAPNIPEVGPMAEDMNDISPFLATHGMDVDENGDICRTPPNGISPNGWMSLLTIAIQDCRRRISELESQ